MGAFSKNEFPPGDAFTPNLRVLLPTAWWNCCLMVAVPSLGDAKSTLLKAVSLLDSLIFMYLVLSAFVLTLFEHVELVAISFEELLWLFYFVSGPISLSLIREVFVSETQDTDFKMFSLASLLALRMIWSMLILGNRRVLLMGEPPSRFYWRCCSSSSSEISSSALYRPKLILPKGETSSASYLFLLSSASDW